MNETYKKTLAGSIGAGLGAIFNASGRSYYVLEHKTDTQYHRVGETQKIIIDQIEIGRDTSCLVRYDETCNTVSRKHAAIVKEQDGWSLLPLSKTNGTYVNGQRIEGKYKLVSGDEMRFSSRGPVVGFIIPPNGQNLVKSIGMTERLNLFRNQALAPYKRAITILCIVFVLAIGGLVYYNISQDKRNQENISKQQSVINEQMEMIRREQMMIDSLTRVSEIAGKQVRQNQLILDDAQRVMDSLSNTQRATRNELDKARLELENAKRNLKKVQTVADATNKAIEEANDRINSQSELIASQAEEIRRGQRAIDSLRIQAQDANNRVLENERKLQSARKEMDSLLSVRDIPDEKIDSVKKEIEDTEADLKKSIEEVDEVKKEIDEAIDKMPEGVSKGKEPDYGINIPNGFEPFQF